MTIENYTYLIAGIYKNILQNEIKNKYKIIYLKKKNNLNITFSWVNFIKTNRVLMHLKLSTKICECAIKIRQF